MSMKSLANSSHYDTLINFLDSVKDKVSDIRNDFKVETEHEVEVRKAMCQAIDVYMKGELRNLRKQQTTNVETYE